MILPHRELFKTLETILLKYGFDECKAFRIASIFTDATLDGFHSHGVHRFPEFISRVENGYINIHAEPVCELALGPFERWHGQLGPGPWAAWKSMERAIALAREHTLGMVALQHNNHWMRGGTYGWQAANEGCIGICFSNTEPNMPPWGGKEPRTGNNPLIIAVPHRDGHLVLDMAMSQFSYGKMKTYLREGKQLPFVGGFDKKGKPSSDPKSIIEAGLTMPIGYWKGAGLSFMLDVLAAMLSGGLSTREVGMQPIEYGLSQVFLAINTKHMHLASREYQLLREMIAYFEGTPAWDAQKPVTAPGRQTHERRKQAIREGVQVDDAIWKTIAGFLKAH